VVLLVSALTACASEEGADGSLASAQSATPSASEAAPTPSASEAAELSYPGENGRTALELLLEADPDAVVEGEGEMAFVTAIGGHAADPDSEFWALYVDGEPAQVGAGALETESGQTITWKLEAFK
jgi:hypothetical protein